MLRKNEVEFVVVDPVQLLGDVDAMAAYISQQPGAISGSEANEMLAAKFEGTQIDNLDISVVTLEQANLGYSLYARNPEGLRPHRPKHPGTLAVWTQLGGETTVRVGTSNRRRTASKTLAVGEAVAVVGPGKRSYGLEKEGLAQGLLTEFVPHPELYRGSSVAKQRRIAVEQMPNILNDLSEYEIKQEVMPEENADTQQPERPDVTLQDLRPLFYEWEREDPEAAKEREKLLLDVDAGVIAPEKARKIVRAQLALLANRRTL